MFKKLWYNFCMHRAYRLDDLILISIRKREYNKYIKMCNSRKRWEKWAGDRP